jgi:hypothetical protein
MAMLVECLRRERSWKDWHGFPADIRPADAVIGDWRHVAIDTPVRWTAALVRVEPNQIGAFAPSSKKDTLDLTPLFTLDAGVAAEVFPELASPSGKLAEPLGPAGGSDESWLLIGSGDIRRAAPARRE